MMYMTGYWDKTDVKASNNDALGSGVCVKSCPTDTQLKDKAWWTANCKSNSVEECDVH